MEIPSTMHWKPQPVKFATLIDFRATLFYYLRILDDLAPDVIAELLGRAADRLGGVHLHALAKVGGSEHAQDFGVKPGDDLSRCSPRRCHSVPYGQVVTRERLRDRREIRQCRRAICRAHAQRAQPAR